jgi:hypothetical protein
MDKKSTTLRTNRQWCNANVFLGMPHKKLLSWGRDINKKEKFHFLPCSCAFVTHITPFNRTSTKISHLGDLKYGFNPVLAFCLFSLDRTNMLCRCGATKCVKIGGRHRRSCPYFSAPIVPFLVIIPIIWNPIH